MATDNEAIQDTARAAYVAELEEAYAHIESAEQLQAFDAATRPDYVAYAQLIRELRNLAIELNRQAHKPFHYYEEPCAEEDLAKHFWTGRNEGILLATAGLEHLLEEPSSKVP